MLSQKGFLPNAKRVQVACTFSITLHREGYYTVATLTSTPHISSSIFRSHNVAVFEWCTGQTPDANKVGRLCRFYVLFPIIYYADVLTYGADQ